jgi:hypothetical protein
VCSSDLTEQQWRLAAALLTGLVLYTARKLPLDEAAALGVTLIGVVFNPANYYLHAVFFLVVMADEVKGVVTKQGRIVWLALTLMCAGSYFTDFTADMGQHFRFDTWVLFAALAVVALSQLVPWRQPQPQAS